MANGKYETTKDMFDTSQSVEGKTKLKLNQNIGKYYDK